MSFRFASDNPADAVEEAFFRIQREQMADVPILNAALSVEAVDFQRWQGHWLGVVVTPWCMSLLLLPGSEQGWVATGDNKRRFVRFPAGDFAFLGSSEVEVALEDRQHRLAGAALPQRVGTCHVATKNAVLADASLEPQGQVVGSHRAILRADERGQRVLVHQCGQRRRILLLEVLGLVHRNAL